MAAYILESPYQDLKVAVWNRIDIRLPPGLSHAAYGGLMFVSPLFLPHLDEISPVNAIGAIPDDVPVLILAGAADRLARPKEAQLCRASCLAQPARLAARRRPRQPAGAAPELYSRTVLEFVAAIATPANRAGAR